jgi:ankyrin repeat protein
MKTVAGVRFFDACSSGRLELIAEVLSAGGPPDVRDENQLTGLIWAARKGQIPVARMLLDHGASIEAADVRGRTALFHAVSYKRYEFVEFLAQAGANLSPVDSHGWSPLDVAEVSQFKKMADLLRGLGARPARHDA